MKIEREPDHPTPYVDGLGRGWSVEKLDDMLGDPEVAITVQAGASISLRPNGTWDRYAMRRWGEVRFPRWEVAALVVVLVERWFDTAGAHYLRPESCA